MLEFKGAFCGQKIVFYSDLKLFMEPNCALIIAFYHGDLILTYHKTRGWELPGGTRQSNEWIIQTAIRELYEETGAEVERIEPIAQYKIIEFDKLKYVKTIYISTVKSIHPLPYGYETDRIKLFKSPPKPESIKTDKSYSPLVKDMVYEYAIAIALEHRYYLETSRHDCNI